MHGKDPRLGPETSRLQAKGSFEFEFCIDRAVIAMCRITRSVLAQLPVVRVEDLVHPITLSLRTAPRLKKPRVVRTSFLVTSASTKRRVAKCVCSTLFVPLVTMLELPRIDSHCNRGREDDPCHVIITGFSESCISSTVTA